MMRLAPWILSAILLIAFIASFSELQRMRSRFGEVSSHAFHDHADVRHSIIKSALAQTSRPIVLFGDSVAELARLPDTIGDRPVVNAGIGGATLAELTRFANELDGASLVLIVAGSNDIGSQSFEQDYANLLASLKPTTIAMPITSSAATNAQIFSAAKQAKIETLEIAFSEFDGLHPTPKAYSEWRQRITEALFQECPR